MTTRSHPLQTLSVKDIAERIKRPGEELQVTVDRLRNWTDQGLIHQVGEKNPGKGRARRYGRDALLEAALLEVLTDPENQIEMPAVRAAAYLRAVKKEIAADWEEAGPLRPGPPAPAITYASLEGAPGGNSLDRPFLVIGRSHGKGGTRAARVLLRDLPHHLQPERYPAHILIDLQLTFEQLLRPVEGV
jgi:hypothetical protein